MKNQKFVLSVLPEKLGICHFGKNSEIPAWAYHNSGFFSVTKTPAELSVVCPQEQIPENIRAEKDWRAFKLEGPTGMYSVGIIAALAVPLAEAGISIFNISTYETDYIMVEEKNLAKAKAVLGKFCEIKN